jgi:hypothetical protein
MWRCRACEAKDATIAMLREQLAAAEAARAIRESAVTAERGKLLDRLMAVCNPPALAAVRPEEPCRTFAADETGTTVLAGGKEHEALIDGDGDASIMFDGQMVKLREYDLWTKRAEQEASGVDPATV